MGSRLVPIRTHWQLSCDYRCFQIWRKRIMEVLVHSLSSILSRSIFSSPLSLLFSHPLYNTHVQIFETGGNRNRLLAIHAPGLAHARYRRIRGHARRSGFRKSELSRISAETAHRESSANFRLEEERTSKSGTRWRNSGVNTKITTPTCNNFYNFNLIVLEFLVFYSINVSNFSAISISVAKNLKLKIRCETFGEACAVLK